MVVVWLLMYMLKAHMLAFSRSSTSIVGVEKRVKNNTYFLYTLLLVSIIPTNVKIAYVLRKIALPLKIQKYTSEVLIVTS